MSEKEFKAVTWQIIEFWEQHRRKPELRELVKDFEFGKTGLVSASYIEANRDRFLKVCKELKERWGIEQIADPYKSYKELGFRLLYIFGVTPIKIKAVKPEGAGLVNDNEFADPKAYIEDNKYVTLKIDITQNFGGIVADFKKSLRFYQEALGSKDDRRKHLEKRLEYYKVWDLWREGHPFLVIDREMNFTKGKARKRWLEAYKLIMEKPYRPESHIKDPISLTDLDKKCEDCRDKENLPCLETGKWVPCSADVEAYYKQDEVKRREGLQADYRLLYSEDPED